MNEARFGDSIALCVPGGGAGAGVAGLARGCGVEMEAYGEIGERRDGKRKRVGDELRAGRNGDVDCAGEGEGAVGGRVDCGR